jgi:hypothetical protein
MATRGGRKRRSAEQRPWNRVQHAGNGRETKPYPEALNYPVCNGFDAMAARHSTVFTRPGIENPLSFDHFPFLVSWQA